MLQLGFVAEVEKLMQRGDLHPDCRPCARWVIGLAWQFLRGEVSHADFVAKALAATRQLAKRQLTWLRQWLESIQSSAEPDSLAEQLLQKL